MPVLTLINARLWLNSNNRCRKSAPRQYYVSFYPLRKSVFIEPPCDYLFWALRPVSCPHYRPRTAPRSSIPRWRHANKYVSPPATRMARLLVRGELETKAMAHTPLAWVWLSMMDKWLILMVRYSAAEQETLMELWSLYPDQGHRMMPMLCLNLQSGARRTLITPGWVGYLPLPLLYFDESFQFPRTFPIFCHGAKSDHQRASKPYWPKQQRGGTGNVHKDEPAPTVHKGLADVLKDKIGLGKKKTSGS